MAKRGISRGPKVEITDAMVSAGLDAIAAGDATAASVSRSWGRSDNYLYQRASRNPVLRERLDRAMLAAAEAIMSRASVVALDVIERAAEEANPDRAARALKFCTEVVERHAEGARRRETERAARGIDPQALAERIAAFFAPAEGAA